MDNGNEQFSVIYVNRRKFKRMHIAHENIAYTYAHNWKRKLLALDRLQ